MLPLKKKENSMKKKADLYYHIDIISISWLKHLGTDFSRPQEHLLENIEYEKNNQDF